MNGFITAISAIAYIAIVTGTTTPPDRHHGTSLGCNCNNAAPSASQLISQALDALGGETAIAQLTGVIYDSGGLYRSSTVMQNYNLVETDRYVAISGNQNVSFTFQNGTLRQRIDRFWQRSDYWYFAMPTVPPAKFSLVLQDGSDGYACFVSGNNLVTEATDVTAGYTDAPLADYLVSEARKLSPRLLLDFQAHNTTSLMLSVSDRDVQLPAVYDPILNLIIAFDPATSLPYIVRSLENHAIFGPSTNDLQLYNYTTVDGIKFPQRIMRIYNNKSILEDTTISQVIVNPEFPSGFFDGLPQSESSTPKVAPSKLPGYSAAEIGEYYTNTLWSGPYQGTFSNITVTQPAADLPGLYRISFVDAPGLEQIVLEFEDDVIVMESPPHQTDLVIRWVNETIKKPISHLWLSHHHHDHTYAAKQYVELGAKLIVPEISASYWQEIPNAQVVTFTDDEPYKYNDSTMQARFIWSREAPHAIDWTYSVVTTACPTANSSLVAYVADAWSTSVKFDDASARSWLQQALEDGLSRDAIVVVAHGTPTPVIQLIDYLGFHYPNLTTVDWKTGGRFCEAVV